MLYKIVGTEIAWGKKQRLHILNQTFTTNQHRAKLWNMPKTKYTCYCDMYRFFETIYNKVKVKSMMLLTYIF